MAARAQVRLAAQQLGGAIDGQPEKERAQIQRWARDLRTIEAEMERHLSNSAN